MRWRVRAPLTVAGARLRARPGRAVLIVVGVAASTSMLVGVLGGSLVTQDLTIRRSVDALPTAERSFRVDAFGLPESPQTYARTDRTARSALGMLTPRTPLRIISFRTLSIAGEAVRLAGVDGLARVARLRSGRFPRRCVPSRCEVLQIGVGGRAMLDEGPIHLVRVGIAQIPARASYGSSFSTSSAVAGHGPVLLLAAGAVAFERLAAFEDFYRVYSWLAPLDALHVHSWQLAGLLARESLAQAALDRAGAAYQLTAPDTALLDARREGRIAEQRLLLVGGEISALLLGFGLVAAMGLRRGLRDELRRLALRGATLAQATIAVVAEVAALTLVGTLVGLGAGATAVALIARAAGLPAGASVWHALVSRTGGAVVAGSWLAVTLAFVVVLGVRERRPARRVRLLDVAALGAAGAVLLELARGGLSEETLSSGHDGLLLSLLPGLICFVAAVSAGRLLAPLMRLAERSARGQPLALRLGFLALARAPARTTLTVGFLVASLGLALFAASYGATLSVGAREQAAFAVPLDFTLTTGPRLVLPLDAAPVARYERLAAGVHAYPVLRRTANVAGPGTSVLTPTVLGVPAAAIRRLHWRADFSRISPGAIAQDLATDDPLKPRAVTIPKVARSLSLVVRVRGVPVGFDLVAEDAEQRVVVLPLGERGPGASRLTTHLPSSRHLRRVLGLELSVAPGEAVGLAHRGEADATVAAPHGSTTLGPLTALAADGRRQVVTRWSGWQVRGGGRPSASRSPRLTYVFAEQQALVVRLPQPTDDRPLPVLVSPQIARATPSGRMVLDFGDAQLRARIVGVASRFPAADQGGYGFVIADESWLATALGAASPTSVTTDELWLSTPRGAASAVERRLRRPPFSALELGSRRDRQRELAAQPLAHGIAVTLTAAAILAALLACAGLWVALASDARDERGELFDLEAQGVPPRTLRRQLGVRSWTLVGSGALGGLGLGLLLSRLVVGLVRVSAVTSSPDPPLRAAAAWPLVLAGGAALAAATALIAELTARQALRGDTPRRGSWSTE
jgi:hypothetical protein